MGGSSGGTTPPPARLPDPPGTVPYGQTAEANPNYQAYSFLPTSNVPVSGFSPGMWDLLNVMPGIPESDKPKSPNIPAKKTAAPAKATAAPAAVKTDPAKEAREKLAAILAKGKSPVTGRNLSNSEWEYYHGGGGGNDRWASGGRGGEHA